MLRTRRTVAYSASITIDTRRTKQAVITATDGTGFTIENPTNARPGMKLHLEIRNGSGGVHGDITWGSEFSLVSAWTKPADGTMRRISFTRAGAVWKEIHRSSKDLAYTNIGVY